MKIPINITLAEMNKRAKEPPVIHHALFAPNIRAAKAWQEDHMYAPYRGWTIITKEVQLRGRVFVNESVVIGLPGFPYSDKFTASFNECRKGYNPTVIRL